MNAGSPLTGSTTKPHPAHWKMSDTYWTLPRTNSSPRLQTIMASKPSSDITPRSAA